MTQRLVFSVPARDFADVNPGHGTNTVAEEIQWIREHYAVVVRTRCVADQVEFTVIGEPHVLADFPH